MSVETFGSCVVGNDAKLVELVKESFDLRISALVQELGLRQPQWRNLATFGYMGGVGSWEAAKDLKVGS